MAMLNRHGWNVAAVDLRGYGHSEGLYASFGGREAGDVRAWLDALADRVANHNAPRSVAARVWGRSMGAAICAAGRRRRLSSRALVIESPMVDLDVSVADSLRRRHLPFARLLARLITRLRGQARRRLLEPASTDRFRPARRTARPCSSRGPRIGSSRSPRPVRLAASFSTLPRWLDFPNAGHTDIIDVGGDELLDRIAAFLDETTHDPASVRSVLRDPK